MTWLGTVGHLVRPRLPASSHALRPFERDGHIYELIGVRAVKRLLRRGPLAAFNPDLRIPASPTAAGIARLDQRMRDAEASHCILLVRTMGIALHAAAHLWWAAAASTLVFDVLMNGYPVILQRDNRAPLHQRFDSVSTLPAR